MYLSKFINIKSQQAITNALRYFPPNLHRELAREFALELENYGHIYMYRLKPSVTLK
jgi:urocanate hydratase